MTFEQPGNASQCLILDACLKVSISYSQLAYANIGKDYDAFQGELWSVNYSLGERAISNLACLQGVANVFLLQGSPPMPFTQSRLPRHSLIQVWCLTRAILSAHELSVFGAIRLLFGGMGGHGRSSSCGCGGRENMKSQRYQKHHKGRKSTFAFKRLRDVVCILSLPVNYSVTLEQSLNFTALCFPLQNWVSSSHCNWAMEPFPLTQFCGGSSVGTFLQCEGTGSLNAFKAQHPHHCLEAVLGVRHRDLWCPVLFLQETRL